MHYLINIQDVSLSFANKIYFSGFSAQIITTKKIVIIGSNGTGKSSLLKIFAGKLNPTSGDIKGSDKISIGYIPQILESNNNLSGGEFLISSIFKELNSYPDLLLLDEPTNHLDKKNRKTLIEALNNFCNTFIIATHDIDFINSLLVDEIWHINLKKIIFFKGSYDDYIIQNKLEEKVITQQIKSLNMKQKEINYKMQQEEQRKVKSKRKGLKSKKQNKWAPIVGNMKKQYAEKSTGKKIINLTNIQSNLNDRLKNLYIPKELKLNFNFLVQKTKNKNIINVSNGSIAYDEKTIIVSNIYLTVNSDTRLAIKGNNGSGKTTLVKALLNDTNVIKSGSWNLPRRGEIGYLDQYYSNIDLSKTVIENINYSSFSYKELRDYLHKFLFNTNQDVNKKAFALSGGERVRLSLAKIILNNFSILILDEITNNLDLETKSHVIEILKEYPSAFIVISHDEYFLKNIDLTDELIL